MATITIDEVINNEYKPKKDKVNAMQNIETALTLWCYQVVTEQFKWKNLPKEIPFYAIEKALFYSGACVLFKVSENYYALPCTQGTSLNLYNEPLGVYAIGFNGVQYSKLIRVADKVSDDFTRIEKAEAVLIRNNINMTSTISLIKPILNRLMYIWQSIGIAECLSRTKAVIHANKDLSKAMKEQFNSIFNNSSPFVVINDKQFTDDKMDSLTFDSSFDVTNYWDDFDNTLSLLLTLIGVKNLNQKDKKERLTSAEVDNNEELIGISEDTRLSFRKDACNKAKEIFGLNIDCVGSVVEENSKINNEEEKEVTK